MSDSVLLQKDLIAIIVGNGAIGSALAGSLLRQENLGQLFILQRNEENRFNDPRVTIVSFDAQTPETVDAAATLIGQAVERVHLVINTVGLLHSEQQQPEKQLNKLAPANLQRSFAINAVLLPVLVQAFSSLLRHQEHTLFASLSARVGSIEDNRLGGWYSYRASKAAHNMLLRTIAREWRLTHRNAMIVALHPGTVESRLSQPFVSPGYKNTVHAPSECAENLLQVLASLDADSSGGFFDWKGEAIAW